LMTGGGRRRGRWRLRLLLRWWRGDSASWRSEISKLRDGAGSSRSLCLIRVCREASELRTIVRWRIPACQCISTWFVKLFRIKIPCFIETWSSLVQYENACVSYWIVQFKKGCKCSPCGWFLSWGCIKLSFCVPGWIAKRNEMMDRLSGLDLFCSIRT
jgi:hypothetical protein